MKSVEFEAAGANPGTFPSSVSAKSLVRFDFFFFGLFSSKNKKD